MTTQVHVAKVVDPDTELIPFLSTKLTACFKSWMQSNYFNLFTNYKTIFNAYNELQSEYNKIKQDNTLKQHQIESLQMQIKSATATATPTPEYKQSPIQNTENMNNEYFTKLENKIKMLENELIESNNKYQNDIRYLKEENKNLTFKSDFNQKCVQNEIRLNEMNYQQTKQNLEELTTNHRKNIKSIHLFLNDVSNRWQMFLNKYSNSNLNHQTMINNNNNNNNNNNILTTHDIEPKLTTAYANLEQFLLNISMLMLSKERDHFNNHNISDLTMTEDDNDDT